MSWGRTRLWAEGLGDWLRMWSRGRVGRRRRRRKKKRRRRCFLPVGV